MTYRVTATKSGHGWELRIHDIGTTRSESVAAAEAVVRRYLRLDGRDAAAPIEITFEVDDRRR